MTFHVKDTHEQNNQSVDQWFGFVIVSLYPASTYIATVWAFFAYAYGWSFVTSTTQSRDHQFDIAEFREEKSFR